LEVELSQRGDLNS